MKPRYFFSCAVLFPLCFILITTNSCSKNNSLGWPKISKSDKVLINTLYSKVVRTVNIETYENEWDNEIKEMKWVRPDPLMAERDDTPTTLYYDSFDNLIIAEYDHTGFIETLYYFYQYIGGDYKIVRILHTWKKEFINCEKLYEYSSAGFLTKEISNDNKYKKYEVTIFQHESMSYFKSEKLTNVETVISWTYDTQKISYNINDLMMPNYIGLIRKRVENFEDDHLISTKVFEYGYNDEDIDKKGILEKYCEYDATYVGDDLTYDRSITYRIIGKEELIRHSNVVQAAESAKKYNINIDSPVNMIPSIINIKFYQYNKENRRIKEDTILLTDYNDFKERTFSKEWSYICDSNGRWTKQVCVEQNLINGIGLQRKIEKMKTRKFNDSLL